MWGSTFLIPALEGRLRIFGFEARLKFRLVKAIVGTPTKTIWAVQIVNGFFKKEIAAKLGA